MNAHSRRGVRFGSSNVRSVSGVCPRTDPVPRLISDLPDNVTSQVRLSADDTAMYLTMEGADDSLILPQDLDRLCGSLTGAWSLTPESARWCR